MEIEELAFALVLPAIYVFLQLLYPGGSRSGDEREASFNPQIICVFVIIALVLLTVSMPFPSCYFLKISILSIILACASLLSSSLSPMLKWLPYLSGIRPIYHLLPNRFQTFLTEADQQMGAAIELYLVIHASELSEEYSSPRCNQHSDAQTSSPSTSTATQLESGTDYRIDFCDN